MRYEKYIGDISIELEGEPEEIIQVLKYLDNNPAPEDAEIVVKIDENEIARTIVDTINEKSKCGNKGVSI